MIKKTLYFGNPTYLSLRQQQLVIQLPEVEANDTLSEWMKKDAERTIPIEDIGVVVLDNRRITITSGAMSALVDNNCAVITCDERSMPQGLLMPLTGNTIQQENMDVHIKRVKSYLPDYGKVGILYITDRQFGEMQVFYGQKAEPPKPVAIQLELF